MAAKPGGLVSSGSRGNRETLLSVLKTFPAAPENSKGSDSADCYQKFNRKEDTTSYHKPKQLVEEITRLFHLTPKLSPAQMHEAMSTMIDPADNGLLFCWSKRGTFMPSTGKNKKAYDAWSGCSLCDCKPCQCNGKLLTLEELTAFLSYLNKKSKSKGMQAS